MPGIEHDKDLILPIPQMLRSTPEIMSKMVSPQN
jgi:hypothetical protein